MIKSKWKKIAIRIAVVIVLLTDTLATDGKVNNKPHEIVINDSNMPRQHGFVGTEIADAEYIALSRESNGNDDQNTSGHDMLIWILLCAYLTWELWGIDRWGK